MVIFSPLKDITEQAPSRSKIIRAHTLALEMFLTSFQEKEDHDSIKAAMDMFPTEGIYTCVISDNKKQGKKR
jgi:hypothetical protein